MKDRESPTTSGHFRRTDGRAVRPVRIQDSLARSVVALFEVRGDCADYLGSAFFVSEDGSIITAAHVLPDDVEATGSIVISFGQGPYHEARVQFVNEKADLAVLSTEFRPKCWLPLANPPEVYMFDDVACYEYSQSSNQQLHKSNTNILATPSGRSGVVSRFVPKLELEGVCRSPSDDMLVVSFPTVQGASGAPVVRRSDCHVVGVIVMSWSMNEPLAEVQEIVEVTDEPSDDGTESWPRSQIKEIRRSMVPQGLAVHVRHVIEMLASMSGT